MPSAVLSLPLTVPAAALHPLEPLSIAEITQAVALVRADDRLGGRARFVIVTLHEPSKKVVQGWKPGNGAARAAFISVLDPADSAAYEVIVSLTESVVKSWRHIPGVQPMFLAEEGGQCEALCKADPEFQAALARRGVTDLSLVMVEAWPAGAYWGEHNAQAAGARPGLGPAGSRVTTASPTPPRAFPRWWT